MKILTEKAISDIRLNPNKYSWIHMSYEFFLSEDFIREFQDYVDWIYISSYQILSENFISEFQHKVDWINISYSQNLSENFIRKFINKLYIKPLLHNPYIPDDLKQTIKLLS